uniref:Reverse transcriptase/retrotransposon-derived protein RNase H-like domain-containing protein n=1 Tax=Tanacetum cinerariifolium TaxID=118510 RepID=A0A699HEC8_TANCI|nr:hypothetical protein [Tanacetum cinerariifolium]
MMRSIAWPEEVSSEDTLPVWFESGGASGSGGCGDEEEGDDHQDDEDEDGDGDAVTKIEFSRFGEEDVRGWLFKYEQFFKVDGVADNQKGEEFVADMMILPLGGCEMVLGIQWLSTLGNIICNFRDLKMSFQYNRRTIKLRGSQKGVVQWFHVLSMVSAKPTTNNAPKGLQTLLEDYNDVPYRHPATQKDAIESMVQEFLDVSVIRHNQSPFSCPIVMVKRKNGSWRMCVDYRRFIKDYAMISYPLTKLLRKNAFVWNNEAEQAFMQLKEAIMVAPVLKLPNFKKDFVVETDASGEGFDYEIKYKRGKDNAATNALSRIHGNAQLLHMLVFTVSTDVQQRIVEIWTDDVEIQALIAKLKTGKDCAKHYSWGTLRSEGDYS